MKETDICNKLIEYTKLIWDRKLTESTGGNMSIRFNNKIYITPTMYVKHFITVDDLVILNMDGKQIGGKLKPSSEYKMHLSIYNERDDINSILHAHPRWSLLYAINNKRIPIRILPESIFMLGEIEYLSYIMPGTDEFAKSFINGAQNNINVYMLQNHGVTTCGKSIESAFARLETLETISFVSYMSSMANDKVNLISKEQSNNFLKNLNMDQIF